jgi:5'-nucleotidase
MKLLLTNDDGIDAAGLKSLERAVSGQGEIVVVAPREPLSGCSHQVSTQRPIDVVQVGPSRYAVDGTPADCTRLGLVHFAPDADWVIAGINCGGNLGADVYMSGTVAAVREGALLGKPGIAVSQFRRTKKGVDWAEAEALASRVIDELWARPTEPGVFWNVNLPDPEDRGELTKTVLCPVDPNPLPIRFQTSGGRYVYRGVYQERAQEPGADVAVCFSGHIAVSRLSVLSNSGDCGR